VKNMKKILILALVLSALMCVNAFAAEITEITDKAAGVTAEPKTIADKGDVAVDFSYSGVTPGNMYLVLILEAEEDGSAPLRPTSTNILYVNQGTAADSTIAFDNLYPSEVKESYIFLAGADVALSGNPLAKINLEQAGGGSFTVEALGADNAATYEVSADLKTLSVANDQYACVVAYTDSARETYTRLAATANGSGYDFDISAVPDGSIIVIAVKGDITGDGKLAGIEITRIKAEQLGKTSVFTALQKLVADVNGDGELKGIEVTQTKAAQLGKTMLAW